MKTPAFTLALVALCASAFAAIKTETVEYKDGSTVLEGFIAYDDAKAGPVPGVLVIHDWTGLQDYAKRRTTMLAEMGYVAFAADVYGKGVRPTDPKDASAEASKYRNDPALLHRRLTLALDALKQNSRVEKSKIAAIGYCFGGQAAIEIARSGADVKGVVSFHGALKPLTPVASGGVKAKVLVCHGADDPFVKPPEVDAFKAEMAQAKADMRFIAYPGAVHSFTKKEAGDDPSKGQAYNEKADLDSWAEMRKFFGEIFG